MFKQDWMMRQIETLARSIAYLVFQKQDTSFEVTGLEEHRQTETLFNRLGELVSAGEIGRAEDLLYEQASFEDPRYLEVAVDFYARLNGLSDKALSEGGFSREEIGEGLREFAARFGVALP